MKDFNEAEIEAVNSISEFLSKVPDQYQTEAKDAFHAAWKLGVADRPIENITLRVAMTRCPICKQPQFLTPSGTTCRNGHGY